MKPETLVMKIIEAMETNSPTLITYNAAAGAATGGISAAVKAANANKAAAVKEAEERRHNLVMEREAAKARGGSGVGDILGTVKEFGQRFGEEAKKTVKEGLSKLIDNIDTGEMKVKHKGNAKFFKNIRSGEGIFLSKYKGNGVIFVRTVDDVKSLFSNPSPELPKSISPIIDEAGLLFNGFRIRFRANTPEFIIDTKDYIYTLTRGLIDLMNGEDVEIADYKDLAAYSKFLHAIRKTGPETRRSKEVKLYIRVIEHDEDDEDDYAEDYPQITKDIDEFENMVTSGQGITFLSDNNKELLNRLKIILAAMKEGHRSGRQYNEVNGILKRLLEKKIITKKDYINVITNVQ
ncbi:hypothetical protein LOTGIDRAFT_156713 [Lottia gigantea]|uniref:Uncharacterized protein n=1 Tax=Lottia gigantea TaxID=225164 RepID=V4AYQ3_LOTGI|nr:hypothetical protein LOTGIDRAFT_156713 [Lottia gigantea]ESP02768.1 hypothetical protein LOTGIDRAFT_156713 [Lottia gigantea]